MTQRREDAKMKTRKPEREKGRKGARETARFSMACNINAEGGPATHWSILRGKKFDGSGPVSPRRVEFKRAVTSTEVAAYCLRELTRDGFSYFDVYPTEGRVITQ
jgi:hypothetical protein